eukprot:gene21558-28551_t
MGKHYAGGVDGEADPSPGDIVVIKKYGNMGEAVVVGVSGKKYGYMGEAVVVGVSGMICTACAQQYGYMGEAVVVGASGMICTACAQQYGYMGEAVVVGASGVICTACAQQYGYMGEAVVVGVSGMICIACAQQYGYMGEAVVVGVSGMICTACAQQYGYMGEAVVVGASGVICTACAQQYGYMGEAVVVGVSGMICIACAQQYGYMGEAVVVGVSGMICTACAQQYGYMGEAVVVGVSGQSLRMRVLNDQLGLLCTLFNNSKGGDVLRAEKSEVQLVKRKANVTPEDLGFMEEEEEEEMSMFDADSPASQEYFNVMNQVKGALGTKPAPVHVVSGRPELFSRKEQVPPSSADDTGSPSTSEHASDAGEANARLADPTGVSGGGEAAGGGDGVQAAQAMHYELGSLDSDGAGGEAARGGVEAEQPMDNELGSQDSDGASDIEFSDYNSDASDQDVVSASFSDEEEGKSGDGEDGGSSDAENVLEASDDGEDWSGDDEDGGSSDEENALEASASKPLDLSDIPTSVAVGSVVQALSIAGPGALLEIRWRTQTAPVPTGVSDGEIRIDLAEEAMLPDWAKNELGSALKPFFDKQRDRGALKNVRGHVEPPVGELAPTGAGARH